MKTSRFLVTFLVAAVVFLGGVTIYQNRVIAKQSSELHWLMSNCSVRVSAPASPAPSKK